MTRTCSWCGQPNGEHTASCFEAQHQAQYRAAQRLGVPKPPPGPWLTLFAIAVWIAIGILLAHLI